MAANLQHNLFMYYYPLFDIIFNENKELITQRFFYRNTNEYIKENNINLEEKITEILENNEIIEITDHCFIYMMDYDFNFHHFMTELFSVFHYFKTVRRRVNKNTKLIIRNGCNFSYETLKLLGIPDDKIIHLEPNKLYYFKNLFINPDEMNKKVFSYLLETFNLLNIKHLEYYPEKIMLVRLNNKRVCNNYEEYKEVGIRNGFFPYSPEEDTLENQISLMNHCKVLLCEVGAGCCNLFFMESKNTIIIMDFFPQWCNKIYMFNNRTRRHTIKRVNCKKISGDEHNASWIANIEELEKII